MMLASTIYMSLMGKNGIREVAEQSGAKAHYLAEQIAKVPGFAVKYKHPFFNEFLVSTPVPADQLLKAGLKRKILAGVDLEALYPSEKGLLVAVTEKRTRTELDEYVDLLKSISR